MDLSIPRADQWPRKGTPAAPSRRDPEDIRIRYEPQPTGREGGVQYWFRARRAKVKPAPIGKEKVQIFPRASPIDKTLPHLAFASLVRPRPM